MKATNVLQAMGQTVSGAITSPRPHPTKNLDALQSGAKTDFSTEIRFFRSTHTCLGFRPPTPLVKEVIYQQSRSKALILLRNCRYNLWAAVSCVAGIRPESGVKPTCRDSSTDAVDESPGGISPPGAPRTVHDPLESHGSRCSAVAMT
jgi:hypothetical protein